MKDVVFPSFMKILTSKMIYLKEAALKQMRIAADILLKMIEALRHCV